jgi:glucosamine 6-phosphate synthetase-like amidotransferase/phosphosugar isomerase protein
MCGIFGFMLLNPQEVALALKVLAILETHKYSKEKRPVGGHGAGVYLLNTDEREIFVKVGKTNGSPAKSLAKKLLEKDWQTRLFIGHVRWASPEFVNTISFKECTQPYLATCNKRLRIVSVHNGFVENYRELRAKLQLKHTFESEEEGELIDSEVIPHFVEDLLLSKVSFESALNLLSAQLENQKGNTVGLLLLGEERGENGLVFVHHGRTRGLTVWSNPKGEVLFSSRKAPVKQVLDEFLKKNAFTEKISIGWREPKHLEPTVFPLLPSILVQ